MEPLVLKEGENAFLWTQSIGQGTILSFQAILTFEIGTALCDLSEFLMWFFFSESCVWSERTWGTWQFTDVREQKDAGQSWSGEREFFFFLILTGKIKTQCFRMTSASQPVCFYNPHTIHSAQIDENEHDTDSVRKYEKNIATYLELTLTIL